MSKIQKAKSRLGRGLSSLISVSDMPIQVETPDPAPPSSFPSEAAPSAAPTGSPLEIPLDEITANPHQPRRHFNEVSLAELAASLKSNGLIQPVIVRRVEDGRYQLVAGER